MKSCLEKRRFYLEVIVGGVEGWSALVPYKKINSKDRNAY